MKSNRTLLFLATSLIALFLLSGFAFAQSTATLTGTVNDSTGAVVTNAHVTAVNTGTNTSRSVQTDSTGNYLMPSLQIGNYRVEVEASGMGHQVVNDLVLEVGRTVA